MDAEHRAAAYHVEPAYRPVEWPGHHAMRTARFWWIALGYFCILYAWYAVQVHQTKYLIEIGVSPMQAAWALGVIGEYVSRLFIEAAPLSDTPAILRRVLDVLANGW